MKLKVNAEIKRVLTVYDMERAEILKKGFEDQENLNDEFGMLARFATKSSTPEILKKDHTICKNHRVWNLYGNDEDGSENLDIQLYVEAYDKWTDAYYQITACLSDVWQIGGTDSDELRGHMYIRRYVNG